MSEKNILEELDQIGKKLQYNPAEAQVEIDAILKKEVSLNRESYLRALYFKGIANMFLEQYESVVDIGLKMEDYATRYQDMDHLIRSKCLIGIGSCYLNQFYESVKSFTRAYDLALQNENLMAVTTIAMNLSEVFLNMENYEQSEEYVYIAKQNAHLIHNQRLIVKAHIQMAEIKLMKKDVQSAQIFISDLSGIVDESLDALDWFYYHVVACEMYTQNDQISQAYDHLSKAEIHLKTINLLQPQIQFNRVAGGYFFKTNDYVLAERHYNHALEIARKIRHFVFEKAILMECVSLYETLNQPEDIIRTLKQLRSVEAYLRGKTCSYTLTMRAIDNEAKVAQLSEKEKELEKISSDLKQCIQFNQKIQYNHHLESVLTEFDRQMQVIFKDDVSDLYLMDLHRNSLKNLRNGEVKRLNSVSYYKILETHIPPVQTLDLQSVHKSHFYLGNQDQLVFACINPLKQGVMCIVSNESGRKYASNLATEKKENIYHYLNHMLLLTGCTALPCDANPIHLDTSLRHIDLSELSQREQEICQFVNKGLNNNEIAEALMISKHTVRNHLSKIFQKLEIKTRFELIQAVQKSHY